MRRGGEGVAIRREPGNDPEELSGKQSPGSVGTQFTSDPSSG